MRERPPRETDQPPGRDPDEERDAHSALNNPAEDPDPTEWPDPYDRRPDPRFPPEAREGEAPHTPEGALSTSEPHPDEDVEDSAREALERDKLDE
jgi:hypothetical protein